MSWVNIKFDTVINTTINATATAEITTTINMMEAVSEFADVASTIFSVVGAVQTAKWREQVNKQLESIHKKLDGIVKLIGNIDAKIEKKMKEVFVWDLIQTIKVTISSTEDYLVSHDGKANEKNRLRAEVLFNKMKDQLYKLIGMGQGHGWLIISCLQPLHSLITLSEQPQKMREIVFGKLNDYLHKVEKKHFKSHIEAYKGKHSNLVNIVKRYKAPKKRKGVVNNRTSLETFKNRLLKSSLGMKALNGYDNSLNKGLNLLTNVIKLTNETVSFQSGLLKIFHPGGKNEDHYHYFPFEINPNRNWEFKANIHFQNKPYFNHVGRHGGVLYHVQAMNIGRLKSFGEGYDWIDRQLKYDHGYRLQSGAKLSTFGSKSIGPDGHLWRILYKEGTVSFYVGGKLIDSHKWNNPKKGKYFALWSYIGSKMVAKNVMISYI